MRKLFKYLCYFIGCYVVLYLSAPICGSSNINEYSEPFYWLEILVVTMIGMGFLVYFDVNPRRHVMIYIKKDTKHTILRILAISLSLTAWFSLMVFISIFIPDQAPIKIVAVTLWLLLFPILCYFLVYRGITLYKNKKIRIFKLKITTYKNGSVEDIVIEELEKYAKINVIINGQDNIFTVPKKDASVYRMKIRQAIDAVKEDRFDSFSDKKDD